MLRATQSHSIAGAVKYFDTVLRQGDYYLGNEISASWRGKLVEELGLDPTKKVTKQQFEAVLSGIHPVSGKKLAQRMRQDRRPGIDFTFSVPKSVSLAWAINGDERIVAAFEEAVNETMELDFETLVHRRVRDGENVNTNNRKQTGKMLHCGFLHQTSRPVDGTVDPHLHIHAFAINLTQDSEKFYAADFAEVMKRLPSLQSKFHSRLARKLEKDVGLEIEKTTYRQSGRLKNGWEIKGIDRKTIETFSRRTTQIEEHAATNDINDPEAKAKLAKETREGKDVELPIETLRKNWKERLNSKERETFAALRAGAIGVEAEPEKRPTATEAVDFALQHHLYRQSTVESEKVVATALEYGLTLSPEQVEKTLNEFDLIRETVLINGAKQELITTNEVLATEEKTIAYAQNGRGTRYPIAKSKHNFEREWLNEQQRNAVNQVLNSSDTVMAISGGAGTGKTSMMRETSEAIIANGKNVLTFAPSTGGRDVLAKEGFTNAETVEHLIRNTKLHETIKPGDVLWIDEAGLMDIRSMSAVFEISKQRNARVVLSGDSRQHNSPRRGEAMRILEKNAGLNVVRITEIQRQKGQYKQAIELISRGEEIVDHATNKTGLLAGFDLLDKLGKIKEINEEDRYAQLANQFIETANKGKSALVIAPTHSEGELVTEHIRNELRKAGAIGDESQERDFTQYRSMHLTEVQKKETSSYMHEGTIVQFHQNVKGGFVRGEKYKAVVGQSSKVWLEPIGRKGELKPLPTSNPDRFEVYSQEQVSLAKGDKIRFTLGGLAKDGQRRFSNGRLDEIAGFDRGGNLKLKSGMTIDKEFGHLDLGYVLTSHSSQGKTTNVSIAAMGADSRPAINARQFYVTASRGSEDLVIYVDDKKRVREAITHAGQQMSATELAGTALANEWIEYGLKLKEEHQRRQKTVIYRAREWWQSKFNQSKTARSNASTSMDQYRKPKMGR